jgi:GAF domain-containing protein
MREIDGRDHVSAHDAFDELAGLALSEHSLQSVLQIVAELTKKVIPGRVEASVSLLVSDRATTVVYTGQLAVELDESQYGHGYGPCLHAAGTGEVVEVPDCRTEPRWADYMRTAVEHGALSSLSLPLGSPERMAAGLNIYAREPGAFTDDSRGDAERFARFAGVAVATMHAYQSARALSDNLQTALDTRTVIDQAKGVLVERYGLTPDQAFKLLAQASMATNRKLRDVADQLVRTGELARPRTSVPARAERRARSRAGGVLPGGPSAAAGDQARDTPSR